MEDLEKKLQTVKEWLGAGSINFFGRPFAGKDTQADRFAKYLGVKVIGGGDIIRGGNAPAHVLEIISRGELAPSDEYRKIIEPYLRRKEFDGKPLLLSSVGRMSGEEPAIIKATSETGHIIKAVVYIDISDEEVIRRLAISPDRNRQDDKKEYVPVRLEWFSKYTLPVLEKYESMGLLVRVDGMQSEDMVFESIVDALYVMATS